MRVVVAYSDSDHNAASTSEMGRFETETLTEEKNLKGLAQMNSQWVERAMAHTLHRRVILDLDSSESPVHGQQEGAAYNGHFECVCYHLLFLFSHFGDCEEVLDPVVERYLIAAVRLLFRADAAFAKPEIYEYLESRQIGYAIRLPANQVLQREIGLKSGIDVVRGEVDSIDPVAMRVGVGGKTLDADYLVVSLGARLAPERVPGLRAAGHNLYYLEGSIAVRDSCRGLDRELKGTKQTVLVAGVPFKCPAAPYEAAMLLAHHAQNHHPEAGTSISLYSPEQGPMGVAGPVVSAGVKGMVAQRGVDYYPKHQVEKVDPESRTLFFDIGMEAAYDFLAYVPPHVVPEVVCQAGLAEGGGWIMVDRESMETRFPGVFSIGDNTSIPLEMGLPLPKPESTEGHRWTA